MKWNNNNERLGVWLAFLETPSIVSVFKVCSGLAVWKSSLFWKFVSWKGDWSFRNSHRQSPHVLLLSSLCFLALLFVSIKNGSLWHNSYLKTIIKSVPQHSIVSTYPLQSCCETRFFSFALSKSTGASIWEYGEKKQWVSVRWIKTGRKVFLVDNLSFCMCLTWGEWWLWYLDKNFTKMGNVCIFSAKNVENGVS